LVIEKATELGVQRIVPFVSAFTVVQAVQDQCAGRLARWQRLAQSAAKQSGNPVPLITPPCSLRDLLTTAADETDKVLLYEKERTLTLKAFAHTHPACSSLWVVIGPEGGFTTEEVEQARATGFQIVGLGTRVVRAETASIAAVALCQFLWGDGGTKNNSL
ncbi:MAG: RsmE family RNA methyltransferase, partial [Candidatus Binatia bacterium]